MISRDDPVDALTAANAKAMIDTLLERTEKGTALPMPQFDGKGFFNKQG